LQQKMIAEGRGGYCFEQNMLLRAGLLAMGFTVTSLVGRVIRGRAPDAPAYAIHMVLRVDLPEGPFLADVGYGSLTPTAPLAVSMNVEQTTPHETMRLVPAGEELTLQAKLGEDWENIYRLLPQPRLDTDYEIANWFTATHPNSLFVNNLIAARPGPGGTRYSLFNERLTIRRPPDQVARRMLDGAAEYGEVLAGTFGLALSGAELSAALEALDRKGVRGAVHSFF
jgi:N-hydroxyarylamine O-acetyltransferase